MKRRYGLAPFLLALALVWLVAGGRSWTDPGTPQLVKVVDVLPRQAELGDRVAVLGEGFPPGKTARVTFDGTLYRPGERPVLDAQVILSGLVVGPDQVHLAFDEKTQALFCGAGARATHTTFEGTVEVAFAAAAAGAPPVAGTLRSVTFDVRPGAHALDRTRDDEGGRFLAWIGLRVAPTMAGLAVEAVEEGSRAQAAAIRPGDILARFDGVRVASAADIVPAAGEREANVLVRRDGSTQEVERTISVIGFRRAPPEELLGAALVLLAAAVVVVFFASPTRFMRSALLQRVVARVHTRVAALPTRRASMGGKVARLLWNVALDALPPQGLAAVVDVLAVGLLASMPFGQYLVAAQLDVGLLFVAAATALSAAALVGSGSFWSGTRAAVQIAWQHVPAAVAIASVVVSTGSLRVQEIEHVQGGWPWDWLAFRSPATLVAFALLLGCAALDLDSVPGRTPPGGPTSLSALVEQDRAPVHSPRLPWLDAARRAHRAVVAGLANALFLGGWLLPGLSPAEQDGRLVLELGGAAWFLAKTWTLVVAMAWVRWALPGRQMGERTRATAFWLAPLAAAAFVASAAWTSWCPGRPEQLLVSGSLVAMVILGVLAVLVRIRHGLVAAGGNGRLSPFL